jgi:hypothetical protein
VTLKELLNKYVNEHIERDRQRGIDETAKAMSLQAWIAYRCTYGSNIDPEKLAALFEAIDACRINPETTRKKDTE